MNGTVSFVFPFCIARLRWSFAFLRWSNRLMLGLRAEGPQLDDFLARIRQAVVQFVFSAPADCRFFAAM